MSRKKQVVLLQALTILKTFIQMPSQPKVKNYKSRLRITVKIIINYNVQCLLYKNDSDLE